MRQTLWLISLGDLLTLLLCFFLAIISLSPPGNPSNTKGSWKKNSVSALDGTKVADNHEEAKFNDWSLTLNAPDPASNELAGLTAESLRGVSHLIVDGCAYDEWNEASDRQSVELVSSVVQKLMVLGVRSDLIEARIDSGCTNASKVVVSGLYG